MTRSKATLPFSGEQNRLPAKREQQEAAWVAEAIKARFGSEGLEASRDIKASGSGPFSHEAALAAELKARLFPLTGK